MLVPHEILEEAAKGNEDSFYQIEKILQRWSVLQLAKVIYEKSRANHEVVEQSVKSAVDEVRSDIEVALRSLEESMRGKWSKAIQQQIEEKNHQFEEFLTDI